MAKDIDIIGLWEKGKEINKFPDIDIDKAIRSRSKGTLFWVRMILTIEFWINVGALPVLVYFTVADPRLHLWGVAGSIVTIIYLFYYNFLIKQIKQFGFEEDVRTSLKKIYSYLRFFLLHYKVVIWLSLAIGLLRAFIEDVPQQATPEQMAKPMFWVVSILVSCLMASVVGGIITFLVHLIYGRKIKRLKKLAKEFSTEEHPA